MRTGSWLVTVAIVLASAGPLAADPADLCIAVAQDAARLSGVPLSVLIAITQTETGRTSGGQTRPWPWTVNMEGTGHWFDTRDEALAYANAQYARGARSFDVGCFQINYRWHGENFISIEQMFDPLANATYAAQFLSRLHAETGDWSQAAGAFHSRTEELATRYRSRFDSLRSAAIAAGADSGNYPTAGSAPVLVARSDGRAGVAVPPRANTFPLLQPRNGARGLGSLVPLTNGG